MSKLHRGVVTWTLSSGAVFVMSWMLVWWPVMRHFRVAPPPLSPAIVTLHRSQPTESVLATVADASLIIDHPLTGVSAVVAARRILRGELALPAFPVLNIDLNFSAEDLLRGGLVQQLFTASLIVPDLLLRAYEDTPDPAFLAGAERYMRGFVEYESRQWLPTGFLWNSHAVTNRVAVLARYWRFTRTGDTSNALTADLLHLHAQRLGALLSKPSQFVPNTNHGLMQNLGLLELATAFPALPEAAQYRRLALDRLAKQLLFYVSSEGAVLEHSAGYQFHGTVLTGHLVRVLQAAGASVPSELQAAHERSLAFMAELQRPDRSMPLWGNTYRYAWRLPASIAVDSEARGAMLRERESFTHHLPVAGAAVWWTRETPVGQPSHTVVNWGRFLDHGHQRAQEMSVLIWAEGSDWSTNTGYWPADDPAGEAMAAGWDGGNAPHVIDEPANEKRETVVLAQSKVNDLRFLDLERSVENEGPRFRRQVLEWKGAIWLVLDSYQDVAKRPLRVVWTAAPEATVVALGPRRFMFQRDGSVSSLLLSVEGSAGVTSSALRGSRSPFGGWVAFDRRAAPAPSIDTRLDDPAGWMLAVAQLVAGGVASQGTAITSRFGAVEDWTISVPQQSGALTFARRGAAISVTQESDGHTHKFGLFPGEDVSSERHHIAAAVSAVRSEYPRFKIYEIERTRSIVALGMLWGGLLFASMLATYRWPRARYVLLGGSGALWGLFAWWVVFVHLAT